MKHKKIDDEVGTKYYCEKTLVAEDIPHTNRLYEKCPVCEQPFRTYGTIWSGTSMVEEGVW